MAIAIVQRKLNKQTGSATTQVVMDASPADGNLMAAAGGHYWFTAGETLNITTPASSYTQRVSHTEADFQIHARGWTDTFAAGDGSTIQMVSSGSADRGGALAVLELSGALGFDVGNGAKTASAAATLSVPPTAAVAVNGSLAIFYLIRESSAVAPAIPSYTKTGTAAGSWTELDKIQVNGVNMEIYVATMPVQAGETVGCDFGNMPSNEEMAGIIMVISPNQAPTVTNPGTVHTGLGFLKPITPVVSDPQSDLSSINLTCTSGKGQWRATAQGAATVTGNASDDVLIAGTHADILATYATATYEPLAQGTDSAVTITAVNGSALSAFATFSVVAHALVLSAADMPSLNNMLLSLAAQSGTIGAVLMTTTAYDSEGLSDAAQTTLSIIDQGLPQVTVPGPQSMVSDVPLPLGTIGITDTLNDLVSCRVQCTHGLLTVVLNGGASINPGQNGSNDLTMLGTQSEILNTLVSLVYTSAPGFSGQDVVTVTATDALAGSDSDAVVLTIQAAVPPPVHMVPGTQNIFSGIPTGIPGVSVADPSNQLVSTKLTVLDGVLHVDLDGGASILLGQNDASSLTLGGTQAAINAALSSLVYTSTDFVGVDTLVVQSVNQGGKTATDFVSIVVVVVPISAIPIITIPPPVLSISEVVKPIPGVSVHDHDGDIVWISLAVVHGALSVSLQSGVSIMGGNNESGNLQLTGTESGLNLVLASLAYVSDAGYVGVDALQLLATDAIGFQSSAQLSIIVNPVPGSEPVLPAVQDVLIRLRENLGREYA